MNIELHINPIKEMHTTKIGRPLILKSETKSAAFIELVSAPSEDCNVDAPDISIGVFRKKDIEHLAICFTDTMGVTVFNDVELPCKISGKVIGFHSDGEDAVLIWDGVVETYVKATDLLKAVDAICCRRSKKGS